MTAHEAYQRSTEVLASSLWPGRAVDHVLGIVAGVADIGGNTAVIPRLTGNETQFDQLIGELKALGYSCHREGRYHLVVRW